MLTKHMQQAEKWRRKRNTLAS